jgi:Alginate lyase
MSEYRNLIIAVVVLISVFNQSILAGWSISDSGVKNPPKFQESTIEDEKLPRTIILDPHELVKMRQAIAKQNNSIAQDFLKTIITMADSVLIKRPISVTEKSELPPNGTKHDYFSLASYEWPNPDTPNGLPYISRDGQINPETLLIKDRVYLAEMVGRVTILAIASYFTEDPKYTLKAEELLRVWFLDNDTYMNPSLKYGDFERGIGRLNPSGIIGANHLAQLVDAIGMLELSAKWKETIQVGLEQWFSKYLDWLLNSDQAKLEGQRKNNHGTYYTVQVAAIANFLNRSDITKQLLKSTMQDLSNAPLEDVSRLITVKINPDGTQPFEIRRTDSLHYHIWNLYGLVQLARIADQVGIDLWNYQIHDTGIRKAVDFIVPYAMGNQSWPYGRIKQLNVEDLAYLQGILCQAMLHYDRQSYIHAYKSLEAENLPLHYRDFVCDLHVKYIDSGYLKN